MKRSRRDEFNEGTKRLLAGRVGWRCAFKGCGVLTVGPQMGKPGVRKFRAETAAIISTYKLINQI